jgi:predicted Zn-dependent peptidase
MKRLIFIALLLAACGTLATAGQATMYTLPNGMEIILKENHATPLVSSIVVVKAGSKYENDQNNGFTHLLEHMLFNGTETRTREQITEGIKDHGGYINAFTRQELTGYLVVMPKEFAEVGLDIQADQLFHSTLPEAEFPKERDIVVEEIKKDNDNVDNVAQDYFNSVVFAGTPYARPVIGYESTIRNVTRDDVMKYYKEHYVPNNMMALIIGDFDSAEMLALVHKCFGAVPRGNPPALPEFKVSPPYAAETQVKEYPSKITYVQIALPAPLYSDPDYYAFDIISQMLNAGESSPLSKALTSGDHPLANEVSVSLDMQKEYTMMIISIRSDNSAHVKAIVDTTLAVLNRLPSKEFTPRDINRVVVPNKVEEIKLEEKLHYYGIMKAPYLVTCGYGFLEDYIDNLAQVPAANVRNAAQKYLSRPRYIACALVPETEVQK